MKNPLRTHSSRALTLLLCALLLSSCMKKPAQIAESGGVGRTFPDEGLPYAEGIDEPNTPGGEEQEEQTETPGNPDDSSDSSNPAAPEKTDAPEQQSPSGNTNPSGNLSASGQTWQKVNGKYVYNLPKRDTSGLATVDEMYSTPNVPMEDQPDDWFPGKWNYDETTGEATEVWDRWPSTMEIINKYHAIYTGDTERRVCYLTFDCGYEYGTTSKILDTLKAKDAPALFFLTGDYVETEYDLMKRMLDEGHLVGNHTLDHLRMNTVTVDEFQRQLNELENLFFEQFPDAQPMVYFRPPSGSCNEWVFKLADKMGYHTVMWSATYKDYDTDNQWSYEDAMATCKNQLRPGVVYLLHAESETNTQILGPLIDWIRGQGYEILPMCDYEP